MRRGRRLSLFAGALAVSAVTAAAALASNVSWGTAIQVPGSGTLNTGGIAVVEAISCPAANTCAAGGRYNDGAFGSAEQPFVADETGGAWGNAIQVPGSAALNADHSGEITAISCASAGNCGAGGFYTDGTANVHAFVVDEKNGVWGTAIDVPHLGTLSGGSTSNLVAISCRGAGNCSATGSFYNNGGHAFVVSEKAGVWGKAIELTGAAFAAGVPVTASAISCGIAGDCTAGGTYRTANYHAFIATEKNGVWSKEKGVPGTGSLKDPQVVAISCTSASACTLGGTYNDGTNTTKSFVASTDSMGAWQKATTLQAVDQTASDVAINSLSCGSAGNCAAGGQLAGAAGAQGFVARSKKGVWSKAIVVPGITAIDNGNTSDVTSISCAGAGNCAAVGSDDSYPYAFVAGMTGFTWQTATDVPGLSNLGNSDANSVISCSKAGPCAIGGGYYNGASGQAFVTAP